MSYIKVIDNGHVIEVYMMEKEPFHLDKIPIKDDGYKALDILNELDIFMDENEWKEKNRQAYQDSLKERENRIEERRLQTVRDAKNTLRRLATANFKTEDLFVTLTYRDKFDDVKEGDKHFKKFIRKMRKEYQQKINYIAVREFTKKGVLHYHVMMDYKTNLNLNNKEIREQLERDFAVYWEKGFVDIQRMDKHNSKNKKYKNKAIDNVGAYLTKYFQKSMNDERLEGSKMYLPSKGLKRPRILKNDEALKFLQEKIGIKKETFTNSYTSEYLGNIVYKEYNLNRV